MATERKLYKLWIHEKQWGMKTVLDCRPILIIHIEQKIFVQPFQSISIGFLQSLRYTHFICADTELVINPDVFKDYKPGDIVGVEHNRATPSQR
jgi:hypothetical protein